MHPSEISVRTPEGSARHRWRSAALRSAALLLVPLAAWLALPTPPPAPAPRAVAPREDEAPRSVVTADPPARTRPIPTGRAEPPPPVAGDEAPRPPDQAATGIAGRVVDEKGAPVMSYWIGVDSFAPSGGGDAGALTARRRQIDDAEGAFELTDLAPGRYELVVSVVAGPLSRSQSIEVTSGTMTRGVRLVVHPGVRVIGNVTDAATHAPLDNARAWVAMGGLATQRPWTRGGQFTLDDAPAERFDLTVTCWGYIPRTVRGLRGRRMGRPCVEVALDRFERRTWAERTPVEHSLGSARPAGPGVWGSPPS